MNTFSVIGNLCFAYRILGSPGVGVGWGGGGCGVENIVTRSKEMCGVKWLLRQYLHYIRDLKQITTATYTMSAGSKKAQK